MVGARRSVARAGARRVPRVSRPEPGPLCVECPPPAPRPKLGSRSIGRWVALVSGALAAACAGNVPPPGGAPRHNPPLVLFFIPETNAVNVRVHEASIQFDEVINQRPQGATDLAGLFLISPWDGDPNVGWHRSRITIRPRHGFRRNTVYTITMLPGIVDLHNNVRRNGATLTFSTGPSIPATIVHGRVFDWLTGQVAPRAFVQAFKPTDTTLVFVAEADSNGLFILPHLAPAEYVVRGFVDANHNRKLDRTEIWDTVHINLVDSGRVELLAFSHDTIGPHISEVTVRDSVTLRVTLDRGLDTTTRISPALFTLKDKDSALVAISGARSAAAYDSAADSATRARTDSIFRSDSARRAAAGLGITDTALARRREARLAARRDSVARLRRPRPSKPSPVHEIVVQLATPLKPGYYRLSAANLRGLLGKERSSDRVFNVPKPPEADSAARARAHADSAHRLRRAPLGPGAPPAGGSQSPTPSPPPQAPPSPGNPPAVTQPPGER